MKTNHTRAGKAGFVSYILVLSTGIVLTLLTVYFYRSTINANTAQATVQLQADYAEKEESILRAILAITPNRAIRAMQSGSNSATEVTEVLRWQNIFTEALVMANARNSISSDLQASLNIPNLKLGNMGDSALGTPSLIFKAIDPELGYVSAGINRSLGAGFPPPLTTANNTTINRDLLYPIISTDKQYGVLAQSGVGLPVETYPAFNVLTYPKINFGYAKPGEPFVAKRNWWAFSIDVGAHDRKNTLMKGPEDENHPELNKARPPRNMVLSIYEIPSQLAISASAFMSLGQYASGEAWQNVTIDGGVFLGKAAVEGSTSLPALAIRRGMTLSSDTVVGGESFTSSPFTPGRREAYQLTQGDDKFFPVSQASESGRVAFIPINRDADFFDRFAHSTESNTVSPTSWNNYSVGALQCAMRLDITQTVSDKDPKPTQFRFDYMLKDGSRSVEIMPLVNKAVMTTLPSGYQYKGEQTGYPTPLPSDQSFTFDVPTDLAYGLTGRGFAFIRGFTGTIRFNNDNFGNPAPGYSKKGYARPASPFLLYQLPSGKEKDKYCIKVLPERIAGFLSTIGAADTSINNSLVVNVDYTTATGSVWLKRPNIPCADLDYGVVLEECDDLKSFPKGFSLVTNLRTYIGDDFNIVEATPPSGYILAANEKFYPPCSLFVPEKRYGVDIDPYSVDIQGQINSLAKVDKVHATDDEPKMIRPMDSKMMSGENFVADRITVNLRPITHPANLPPITMMNWLIVLEEQKRELGD